MSPAVERLVSVAWVSGMSLLVASACSSRPPIHGPTTVHVAPGQGTAPSAPAAVPGSNRRSVAGEYPTCQRSPSERQVERAKELFRAGKQAFEEARYAEAVARWREAYGADCTAHLILLNLSHAYELAGDRRAAARALRAYLDREPTTSRRPQFERRIESLERP